MTKITITIKHPFAALQLTRDQRTGDVEYNEDVLESVLTDSGIDRAAFFSHEDSVAVLLVGWYHAARAAGEPTDPIAEDLLAEARLEDERGFGISYQPGTA
jgi:hypothetical protein